MEILVIALVVSLAFNIFLAIRISKYRRQLNQEREDRRRTDYLHYTSIDTD